MSAEELYAKAANCYAIKDRAGAKKFANKALLKNKNHSKSLNLLGVLAYDDGDLNLAQRFYQSAIKNDETNAQAYNNLGNLTFKMGDVDSAKKYYLHAVKVDEKFLEAIYNLGVLYMESKNDIQAKDYFYKALEINPSFAMVYLNLGLMAKDAKDYAAAKNFYQKCIDLNEVVIDAKLNLAVVLFEEQDYVEAQRLNALVLSYEPDNFTAHNNLGNVYKLTNRFHEALAEYATTVRLRPNYGEAYSNIAICLHALKDKDRAMAAALRSIELMPNSAICYSNFSILLKAYGYLDEALQCLSRACELDPSDTNLRSNLAITLLFVNDYKNGLALYSSRKISRLICDKPQWSGEDIKDKTILVYHEQGFGDTIQFARLLFRLKDIAKKIIFMPQDELLTLYQNSKIGVEIISKQDAATRNISFDYHVALLDLMALLFIFSPKDAPCIKYINVNENKRTHFANLLPLDKFKIGIVWRGNPKHIDDSLRSANLSLFSKIANVPDVVLVSLQKDANDIELNEFKIANKIIDFTDELTDFDDTAALVDVLDMTICVDTSVAHLSATLGKTTWILTAYSPDWRWGKEQKTPWYDSVRLFRKLDLFEWDSTFDTLRSELLNYKMEIA